MELGKFLFGQDNLYRFLSFFGIVISIFSIVYPYQAAIELDEKIIETNYLSEKQQYTQNELVTSLTANHHLYVAADSLMNLDEKSVASYNAAASLYSTFSHKADSIMNQIQENRKEEFKINHKNANVELLVKRVNKLICYFNCLLVFGIAICLIGFYFWYKQQQVIDSINNNELLKSNAEIAKLGLSKPENKRRLFRIKRKPLK